MRKYVISVVPWCSGMNALTIRGRPAASASAMPSSTCCRMIRADSMGGSWSCGLGPPPWFSTKKPGALSLPMSW